MNRKVFLMSDQKNGNAKENNNIIKGPWRKSKRKVKVPDEEFLLMQENLEFAEELNQKIIIQMIHTLVENSIDIAEESFIRDLGLIIELIKGSIYRGMEIPHPTHALFEALVDIGVDEEDGSIHSQIDVNMLEKFVEFSESFKDDDNNDPPEIP